MSISSSEFWQICEQREAFGATLSDSRLKNSLLKGKGGYSAEPLPGVVSDGLLLVKQYIDRAPQGPLRLAVRELSDKGDEKYRAFLRWGVYPAHDLTEEVRGFLATRFPDMLDALADLPVVAIPEEARELPPPPRQNERLGGRYERECGILPKDFYETIAGINRDVVSKNFTSGSTLDDSFWGVGNTAFAVDVRLLKKIELGAASGELRMAIGEGAVVSERVVAKAKSGPLSTQWLIQEYTENKVVTAPDLESLAKISEVLDGLHAKAKRQGSSPSESNRWLLFEVASADPRLLPYLADRAKELTDPAQMFHLVRHLLLQAKTHTLSVALDNLIDLYGLKLEEATVSGMSVVHWAVCDQRVKDEAIYQLCKVAARRGVLEELATQRHGGINAKEIAQNNRSLCVNYYLAHSAGDHPVWGYQPSTFSLNDLSFDDDGEDGLLLQNVTSLASSGELRTLISCGAVVSERAIDKARSLMGPEGVRIQRVLQEYTEKLLVGHLPRCRSAAKTKKMLEGYQELVQKYEDKENGTACLLLLVAKEDPALLPHLCGSCDPLTTPKQMFFLVKELLMEQEPHKLWDSFNYLIDFFGLRLKDTVLDEHSVLHWAIRERRVPDEALYYLCRVAARRGVLEHMAKFEFDGWDAHSMALKYDRPYVARYLSSTSPDDPIWGKAD